MPLVRYEVQSEHSLANPELYRTVGRDDSEGLLEGVAMAGLVGIVRQLGDMAEFAAEIFQELHDEIMAIGIRGQDLKARVGRLETDLPAVEKTLLSESSQIDFAYSIRSKWRAPLPIDQNCCAQGDLPRFVRNFYDDCRGPPRLFLLDKFDEAGRGACVKRYTDPTFFKLTWAATQLEKAERLRREQEFELQRTNSADEKSLNNEGSKIYRRERLSSALFENLEGFTGDFTPDLRSRRLDRVLELPTEGDLTPDGPLSPEEPRSPERTFQKRPEMPEISEGPVLTPLKISVKDIENLTMGHRISTPNDPKEPSSNEEDASNDDFFVDALTTMGSDPDSEPGSRTRWDAEVQSHFGMESDQEKFLNHSVLKAHVEAHHQPSPEGSDELDQKDGFGRRLGGYKQPESPGAGTGTVRESEDAAENAAGSSGGQPSVEGEESQSVDESIANESITSEESDARNEHASISEKVPEGSLLPLHLEKFPEKRYDEFSNIIPSKLPENLLENLPNGSSGDLLKELSETCPDKLSYIPPKKVPEKVVKNTPIKVPEKPTLESHESISLLEVRKISSKSKEQRASVEVTEQFPGLYNHDPHAVKDDQLALANVEQPITTPRSRRLWAKDNGSQIQTSNILGKADIDHRGLSLRFNGGSELNNLLRAGILGGSGHFHEELSSNSQRALIPEEDHSVRVSEQSGYELILHRRHPSSTGSSPYSHVSSSSAHEDDDGASKSSASSSPKGPNFCALLSPPESPLRVARGLMGSPVGFSSNTHFCSKSLNDPPDIPYLSISPTVSRSLSLNLDLSSSERDELLQNYPSAQQAPQLISSPQRRTNSSSSTSLMINDPAASLAKNLDELESVPVTDPKRTKDNGGLHFESSGNQTSTLSNLASRPRTWVGRSESNVAATLRAIRQAAAVENDQDDDTASECRSDC